MVQFEELQRLWQSQPGPAVDVTEITRALGFYGRRQNRLYAAKLAAVVLCVAVAATRLWRDHLALFGLGLIAVTALAILYWEWRNSRAVARLDFTQPSAGFVRAAIIRLERQREPARRPFWVLMAIAVLVLNWMVLQPLRARAPVFRLAAHLMVSLYPLLGYQAGKWVRAWRFEAECRPLLDRLAALERSLQERCP